MPLDLTTLTNRNGVLLYAFQSGYLLMSRTVITATGANTYTPPTGCRALLVELIGAGAGGADAANSSSAQIVVGGGGDSGTYASAFLLAQFPSYTVNVGVGGSVAGTGGSGGTTSFVRGNMTAVSATVGANAPGSIATGTSEIFLVPAVGTGGTDTSEFKQVTSAGKAAHRVSGTKAISGRGAPGLFGGRPQAAIAQASPTPSGGNYGAGGTGGMSVNAGGASTAGSGGQGLAIIWEFC